MNTCGCAFKADDDAIRARIDTRNELESYCYGISNTMDSVKDKLSDEDRTALENAKSETSKWLDENMEASKEEFEQKRKELENIVNPIMTKIYQSAPPQDGAMPPGAEMPPEAETPTQPDDGPIIEEVD